MFTQFKYSPADISQAAQATAQTLASILLDTNPAQFAARTIAERLRADPAAYLQYGPYWWAVKAALAVLGHDLGSQQDPIVFAAYGGDLSDYHALVAGEQFRDFYRRTFLAGTAHFWLNADGSAHESYVLFDADMEARRLGPGAALVSANLNALVLESEPDALPVA